MIAVPQTRTCAGFVFLLKTAIVLSELSGLILLRVCLRPAVDDARSPLSTVAMFVPARPQIYHIVHVDRLASILQQRGLHCDATSAEQTLAGSMIGLASIKARRLTELVLHSHPGLYVGQCVPFLFFARAR